jgi:hypothetical protein
MTLSLALASASQKKVNIVSISISGPREWQQLEANRVQVWTEVKLEKDVEYIVIPCTYNPGECAKYTVAFTVLVRTPPLLRVWRLYLMSARRAISAFIFCRPRTSGAQ